MARDYHDVLPMEGLMHKLGHSQYLKEQIYAEMEQMGEDYRTFEDADEIPESIKAGMHPDTKGCPCFPCVTIRSDLGKGFN
jgi:hypothetical protein